MGQPKVQRNFERRMDFIFSERLYDDLMLAIEEVTEEISVNTNKQDVCNAANVWNIDRGRIELAG